MLSKVNLLKDDRNIKNGDELGSALIRMIEENLDIKGLPFEYTLNGLPPDKLEFEEYAIEKIWEGGSSKEIIYDNVKESLGISIIPIRVKELVELYSAGYVYSFDSITNSYILIKP